MSRRFLVGSRAIQSLVQKRSGFFSPLLHPPFTLKYSETGFECPRNFHIEMVSSPIEQIRLKSHMVQPGVGLLEAKHE
jgi:hypothetical protein